MNDVCAWVGKSHRVTSVQNNEWIVRETSLYFSEGIVDVRDGGFCSAILGFLIETVQPVGLSLAVKECCDVFRGKERNTRVKNETETMSSDDTHKRN